MIQQIPIGAAVRTEAWMRVENPHLSMVEAVIKLSALGHTILAVDGENRRIKVLDQTTTKE